ncbi:MAG TPA: ubiquitin-like small modifier protein 1 [Methanospirillum sp.]|nr:ubiquitin-like small modifier protein 1 [Methanospirillum sp.]
MSLKVLLFANYREIVGKKEVIIDSHPSVVKEVVDELTSQFPGLNPLLYQEGELRRYVNILVDGVTIRETEGLLTPVRDGNEIKIFPPVSGG